MKKDFLLKRNVLYTAVVVNEKAYIQGSPVHMTLNFHKVLPHNEDLGMEVSLKVIGEGEYFNKDGVLENSGLLIDKEEFLNNYPQLEYLIYPEDKKLHVTTQLQIGGKAKNTADCEFEHIEPYGIKGKLAVIDQKGNFAYKIVESNNMDESYLTEVRRSQLLSNSRDGEHYKDQDKGRWDAKSECTVANTVQDYNKIDMNSLWKNDKLKFGVKIKGKTGTYLVTISFENILIKIKRYVEQAKNKFDRESVTRALMDAIDSSDVKVDCTCPDFKYRLAYYATKKGYKEGESETRPANITNPNDNKGALCKHISAALNNASWIRNVASVIVNYANYCKDNMEYNYSRFIFPKIFGIDYNKAIQMCITDYDDNGEVNNDLKSDEATINLSNAIAKNRFKNRGNKKKPEQKYEENSEKDEKNTK